MKKIQKVTWEELHKLCEKVALEFYSSVVGYPIVNSIVTISSGGLIPARLIAENLQNPKIYVYGVRSYDRDGKRCMPVIYQTPDNFFNGQRILIVDDISDSGETLSLIKDKVLEQNPNRLHTLTIHYKPQSKIKPDFFAAQIDNDVWVQYPYEIK